MSDKERDAIPEKRETGEQVDYELAPSEEQIKSNTDPAKMRIDAARMFEQATEQTRMALCISDPFKPDCPIIYVNQAFVDVTGYGREEILGKNCRFLQGDNTDPNAVQQIRDSLSAQSVTVVDILNYRKDGTPFWNALHIGPIYNEQGELAYYYGSQWDITAVLSERQKAERQQQIAEEMQHRTGNLFAVLSAIVRISARGESDVDTVVAKIEDRFGALSRAHRITTSDSGSDFTSSLNALVEKVVEPYRTDREGRIELTGDTLLLAREAMTPVALALHELATNSIKYGSLGAAKGTVSIDWARNEDDLTICWIERGGPRVDHDGTRQPKGAGTGMRIVTAMLAGVEGALEPDFAEEGVTVTIRLPLTMIRGE